VTQPTGAVATPPETPAQPAAVETPPAENPEASAAATELDLTKGWEAESYGWLEDDTGAGETPPAAGSDEKPPAAEPAPKPASAEQTPPAAASKEPPADAGTKLTLTPEQRKAILEDPEVRADIERRANSLVGNRLQQESAAREAKEQEESQWRTINARYEELKAQPADKRDTPEIRGWMARVEELRDERQSRPDPETTARLRNEVVQESLHDWNINAAKAFGETVKTKLAPFYSHLPAATRQHLEAGTQASTDVNWLEEYVDGISQGFMAWHRTQMAEAEKALRNDIMAETPGGNPPMVKGEQAPTLSAREVMRRHMEYGFDGAHGVTEEQLTSAKKELKLEY